MQVPRQTHAIALLGSSGTQAAAVAKKTAGKSLMQKEIVDQQQIRATVLKAFSGTQMMICAEWTANKQRMWTQKKPLAQRLTRATVLWDFFGTTSKICAGKIAQQMRMPMVMLALLLLSAHARAATGGLRVL